MIAASAEAFVITIVLRDKSVFAKASAGEQNPAYRPVAFFSSLSKAEC
jgi:hypothetical protein